MSGLSTRGHAVNRRHFLSLIPGGVALALVAPVLARLPQPALVHRRRVEPTAQSVTFLAPQRSGFTGSLMLYALQNAIWIEALTFVPENGVRQTITVKRNLPKGRSMLLPDVQAAREITLAVTCLPLQHRTTLLDLVETSAISSARN